MTYIQNKAIRFLIDEHTRYGQTERDRVVLDQLTEDDPGKHLFGRKTMKIFIERYIQDVYRERHGRLPATGTERNTIIQKSGEGMFTAYSQKDILSMIQDSRNQDHFHKLLVKNTTLYEGEIVPKVVAKYYREKGQDNASDVVAKNKMTERRVKYRAMTTHQLLVNMQLIIEELNTRNAEATAFQPAPIQLEFELNNETEDDSR